MSKFSKHNTHKFGRCHQTINMFPNAPPCEIIPNVLETVGFEKVTFEEPIIIEKTICEEKLICLNEPNTEPEIVISENENKVLNNTKDIEISNDIRPTLFKRKSSFKLVVDEILLNLRKEKMNGWTE
jgi:hypothetical protein